MRAERPQTSLNAEEPGPTPGLRPYIGGAPGRDGSPLPRHGNNFGVIRLVLASLVVLGHATELVSPIGSAGDPLFRYSGTVHLAGTCVFGFFLLSGYLITHSMVQTRNAGTYLVKRLLRIVPAFVLAYLLSVLVIAPALGAVVRPFINGAALDLLFLHEPPLLFGAQEPHYGTINGSLWTISYEFRCYLLIAMLWLVGILRRRWAVAVLAALLCVLTCVLDDPGIRAALDGVVAGRTAGLLVGTPSWDISYGAAFLVGANMYLYRDVLLPQLTGKRALLVGASLLIALLVHRFALAFIIVLGGVVLFWLALRADLGAAQKINDRWDISYGIYLYGWPCTMVLLVAYPTISAGQLGAAALVMAGVCGCASWWGLERHCKLPARRDVATGP